MPPPLRTLREINLNGGRAISDDYSLMAAASSTAIEIVGLGCHGERLNFPLVRSAAYRIFIIAVRFPVVTDSGRLFSWHSPGRCRLQPHPAAVWLSGQGRAIGGKTECRKRWEMPTRGGRSPKIRPTIGFQAPRRHWPNQSLNIMKFALDVNQHEPIRVRMAELPSQTNRSFRARRIGPGV